MAQELESEQEKANDATTPGFPFFSNFPEEIRDLIWNKACEESRIVDLWTERIESPHQGEVAETNRYPYRYRSTQSSPSILYACRESRSIGLSIYELTFGTTATPEHGSAIIAPARIYVNWDHDLVLLRHRGLHSGEIGKSHDDRKPLNQAAVDDLNNYTCIRRLAISMNEVSDLQQHFSSMKIDELVLYWVDFYPSYERFNKYTNLRIGLLDPADTNVEIAHALRLDASWRRSLWLMIQFRDDYVTDPEEQISICARKIDFLRRCWASRHQEKNSGSEPLKLTIARHVLGG